MMLSMSIPSNSRSLVSFDLTDCVGSEGDIVCEVCERSVRCVRGV